MSDQLWRLERVSLAGEVLPRLAEITLDVRPGITAVLGCSGAGKTSLLNLLVGFEKPDAGRIVRTVDRQGFDLPLFWVPQDGGLWPHLTAAEHVEVALGGTRPGRSAASLLSELDLADRAGAYPGELSMGERSRLAVARALAAGAAVVVMDEPLVHVDAARAVRYWEVIRAYVSRTGASLVYATHSPKSVVGTAERVVCLRGGRVIYAGGVEDLYWRPQTREQAECLGEVNWLEAEEAEYWLSEGRGRRRCYRPEQVTIERSPGAPLVVQASRFRGAIAETDLLDERSGRKRRFYHRPGVDGLCAGARVAVKVLLTLLVVLLLGCGRGAEPTLSVRAVHHWAMPPDGARIPAPRAAAPAPDGRLYVLDTAGRVLILGPDGEPVGQWRMPAHEQGTAEGVCVLDDGCVAVADTHYSRVVIFSAAGEVVRTFGGYGTDPGQFIYPVGIVQDDEGCLYVAEYGSNDRVQKFTREGEFLLSFGAFGTGRAEFQRPSGLAWHEGRLYVADAMNNRVQVFSREGEYCGVLGGRDAPPALHFPYDVVVGPGATLYVVEYGAGRVSHLSLEGEVLGRYGRIGRGRGELHTPWGLAAQTGGRLCIIDTGNRRIVELRL